MRAVHVPAAGEKPQIGDLPIPAVTDGSVLIRVKAAAQNPVDNAIAAGYLVGMLPHEYPLVLGRDAAGVVGGEHRRATDHHRWRHRADLSRGAAACLAAVAGVDRRRPGGPAGTPATRRHGRVMGLPRGY